MGYDQKWLDSLKVADLKAECQRLGLKTSGKKAELKDRLQFQLKQAGDEGKQSGACAPSSSDSAQRTSDQEEVIMSQSVGEDGAAVEMTKSDTAIERQPATVVAPHAAARAVLEQSTQGAHQHASPKKAEDMPDQQENDRASGGSLHRQREVGIAPLADGALSLDRAEYAPKSAREEGNEGADVNKKSETSSTDQDDSSSESEDQVEANQIQRTSCQATRKRKVVSQETDNSKAADTNQPHHQSQGSQDYAINELSRKSAKIQNDNVLVKDGRELHHTEEGINIDAAEDAIEDLQDGEQDADMRLEAIDFDDDEEDGGALDKALKAPKGDQTKPQ